MNYLHTMRLHALRNTLQEANGYYNMMIESGGCLNIDRIGYTCHIKLETFREILDQPDLTMEELSALLRSARNEIWPGVDTKSLEASAQCECPPQAQPEPPAAQKPHTRVPKPVVVNVANDPGRDWATLMARIVLNRANEEQETEERRRFE